MGSDGLVNQVIIFEYVDRDGYYRSLVESGRVVEEMRLVMSNMQRFIDEETLLINGDKVRARVLDAFLGFRGSWRRPYVEIYVEFSGRLKKGLNIYEDIYEREVAEYDYEVLWIFPRNFVVVDYEMAGEGYVYGNILRVIVRRGTEVGGHEVIRFMVQ